MAASTEVRNKFEEILEAARTQGRQNQAATMVVLSHLQQMTLLMIKKGLSFTAIKTLLKVGTSFLHDVIELNRLDIRFPAIIRNFLIDGCGLFYFRPDQKLKVSDLFL